MNRQVIDLVISISLASVVLQPIQAKAECWPHYKKTSLSAHIAKFPLAEYERWNHYALVKDGELQFANSYLGNTPMVLRALFH